MLSTFAFLIIAACVAPLLWFTWWLAADWAEMVAVRRRRPSRVTQRPAVDASADEAAWRAA
jgi:hypothetical protein